MTDNRRGALLEECAEEGNAKWEQCIKREQQLYPRQKTIRSEFYRDYTRILHSTAYRRLKHKTQVFFATENDHICTRIEHVNHVASVSFTIAKNLGLNTELTSAIAIGHDLGHAPFGHQGEAVLKAITKTHLKDEFWHERNSLRFVDVIETLPNPEGYDNNLALTYAVRDGIISHCGEIDENGLRPRDERIDLAEIKAPNQIAPYTWEACVVKVADKVAYLGRDIEDARALGIITMSDAKEFLRKTKLRALDRRIRSIQELNNTVIMNELVCDLIDNSSLSGGIRFSDFYCSLTKEIKDFNYKKIYNHPRLHFFRKYAELIIQSVFEKLQSYYCGTATREKLERDRSVFPELVRYFSSWLVKYSSRFVEERARLKHKNTIVYELENEEDYTRAIVDFISGMTDSFALKCFRELTTFT
jgi:dGTPase